MVEIFELATIGIRSEKLPVVSLSRSVASRRAPTLSCWPSLQLKEELLANERSTAGADDLWVRSSRVSSNFPARVGVIAGSTDPGLRSFFGASDFSGLLLSLISRPLFSIAQGEPVASANAYGRHDLC